MVGREVGDLFPKHDAEIGDVVLEVEGLTARASSTTSRFTVRAGEIVGLAGLVGAGRSEIARAIFGVDPYDAGTVTSGRQDGAQRGNPRAAMAGTGFVPEDRRQQGLVHRLLRVARNITLGDPHGCSRSSGSSRPAPRTRRAATGPAASRSRPRRWTPRPAR